MQCMQYVPSLSVTMGSYTLVDHFFVVDISDTKHHFGCPMVDYLGEGYHRLERFAYGVSGLEEWETTNYSRHAHLSFT